MAARMVIFLLVIAFAGCKGKVKDQDGPVKTQAIADSNAIFDGVSLDGWEISNFGTQGHVYVSDGSIILGMGEGCTGVTYKKPFPVKDYMVTLEAMRVSGNDFFCGMTFPFGDSPCTLIVGGWGGTTVGLSSIDGKDASENETTTLMKFEKNIWYEICLSVREDSVKTWINDSLIIDFSRDGKKMSIRPEVNLSKPFGIASWYTTAALRNIRVERLKEENR